MCVILFTIFLVNTTDIIWAMSLDTIKIVKFFKNNDSFL